MPNMALVEAFPEGVVTSDGTTIHTQGTCLQQFPE
jgi:hypothetical protein